jgi:HprK-related kinase A
LMFPRIGSSHGRSRQGAIVGIGGVSIAIDLHLAWPALQRQISDLYGDYPQHDPDDLPDLTIAIRPQGWRSRLSGKAVRAFANGYAPYQAVPARLAVPAMEATINWYLWKYFARVLLLHAAVIERNGRAVLLPGPSGAGKSTLCTALIARGWRLLTDEIAMVRPQDGQVVPHPRPISLKNEAIEMAATALSDAYLSERFVNPTKGAVAFMRPPTLAIERAGETAEPALVVFPRYRPDATFEVEPIEKAHAFMRLVACSANYFTLLESGFETLANLVESCDHYALSYRSLDDAVSIVESLAPPSRRVEKVA